jgi:uncharacterized protein (DUF1499 family)
MTGVAAWLGSTGVGLGLLLAACATEPPPRDDDALPDNPLPACPDTPNCIRRTRRFDLPADTLFDRARNALNALAPSDLTASPETRRIDAVFRVFVFKDDVALVVEPHEAGAVLHIRSASRIGRRDFGVNRRRVRRFFRTLARLLMARPNG